MKRLAFISFSIVPFASNDLLFYRTAQQALKRGYDVLVSSYDWGRQNAVEYEEICRAGALVHRRRLDNRSGHFFTRQWHKVRHRVENKRKHYNFLSDFAPDVVVISDPGTYHMLSAPGFGEYLMESGLPFITISQFNDENSCLGSDLFPRAQQFFSKARDCVFVSKRNLQVARRQLCLPLNNAVVLDNPPNLKLWNLVPWPPGDIPQLAIVGRFECAVKGQALVLEVLSGANWQSRPWRLNLYGKGPDEEYLRALVHFLGLEDRVSFCGHVDDIQSVWERNMILLLCSSGEGKPLALIEAMLCGRPAVVTDVGGNAELIQEGETGFIAESSTIRGIESALERAWAKEADWPEMGRKAHVAMSERLQPRPEQLLINLIARSN